MSIINLLVVKTTYTPWTPCSKSCGGGVSTRNESCLATQFDGTDKICDRNKMETKRCNIQNCPGEWRKGEWTSCSTTCGNGTKQR